MADTPTYDDFLSDPVGVWRSDAGAVSDAWAVQAARASRAFRVHLKESLCASVRDQGNFDAVQREVRILHMICDASDIAALFSDLTAVRPPADWAPAFAKLFAKPSVAPPASRS